MQQRTSPLTAEHIKAIKDAQRVINDAIPMIVHAEACGSNCEYQKQTLEQQANQLHQFLVHFGPGGLYERGQDG